MNTTPRLVPVETLDRFIHSQERKHSQTTGELSALLSSLVVGVKIIANLVATAGFRGIQGYTGHTNVQGESTRILDEFADQTLVQLLTDSGNFGLLVSEEQDKVVQIGRSGGNEKYVVALDPLDGSSNVGSNIPVGTIFAIYRRQSGGVKADIADFMQPGRNLVAAGYAIYGARTAFVYSAGDGVHGFNLDPTIGEFVLTDASIKSPERGNVYSVNEGRSGLWPKSVATFVEELKSKGDEKGEPYSARYAGSLVADFDRNMRNGGVYLYPADKKSPKGKLRLLYECVPLAFIQEQAGGKASDGTQSILDKLPTDIHERSPLIIGTSHEVSRFEALHREYGHA